MSSRLPSAAVGLLLAACALASGCAGYHIGPVQPHYLHDIHALAVPTFKNNSLVPRVEVLITGSVIKQFQQDGTYRIVNSDRADAILEGEIFRINRSPQRSVQGNVLSTSEFNLTVRVRYRLFSRDGHRPLTEMEEVAGTTSFFVGSDVTTDERQALPLATEELATRLVSQLSEGW